MLRSMLRARPRTPVASLAAFVVSLMLVPGTAWATPHQLCNFGVGFSSLPVEWPWQGAYLDDVTAPTTSEAWAVGATYGSHQPYITHLVDHTFRMEAVPDLPNAAISAITMAGNQPLAVGSQSGARTPHPIALRRDARGWHTMDVSIGDTIGGDFLNDVDAVSARNVWAVGGARAKATSDRVLLVLHWNGTKWTRPSVPMPEGGGQLTSVDARLGDVWAVGHGPDGSFVLHRSDRRWALSTVPVPTGAADILLFDVAAHGPDDVWAVGSAFDGIEDRHAAVSHWDGTAWTSSMDDLPAGSHLQELLRVAVADDGSLVAAGFQDVVGGEGPVVRERAPTDDVWTDIYPTGEERVQPLGVTFVPGTRAAFLVGMNGRSGEPLAFWNCQ